MSIIISPEQKSTFIAVLRNPAVPLEDRKRYNTGVISTGLAYSLPLPSESVASAEDFYATNYKATVGEFCSSLNEEVTIDLLATVECTREVWLNRYRVCYVPSVEEAINLAIKVIETKDAQKPYEQPAAGEQITMESYIARNVETIQIAIGKCFKK